MTTLNQCKKLHILTISLEDLDGFIDVSSKQSRPENSLRTLSPGGRFEDSLDLILSLSLVGKKDFQTLWESLRFSHFQIEALTSKNRILWETIKTSPKDWRASSGTEYEGQPDYLWDPRAERKRPGSFKSSSDYQWIPSKASAIIQLGGKKLEDCRPRPIMAKFKHFKQKEFVRSQGWELKGTNFSMSDWFPREMLQHNSLDNSL